MILNYYVKVFTVICAYPGYCLNYTKISQPSTENGECENPYGFSKNEP